MLDKLNRHSMNGFVSLMVVDVLLLMYPTAFFPAYSTTAMKFKRRF